MVSYFLISFFLNFLYFKNLEGEEALVFICIIFAGLIWLIMMLYHCYRESKEPGEEVTIDHPYWHVNSMRTPRQPKQSTPSPSPDQVLFQREDVVEHQHQLLHQHRPNSQFRINQNCSQQLLATPLHFRVQVPIHSPSTSTSTSTQSLIHSSSMAVKMLHIGSFVENLICCCKVANVYEIKNIWNPFLSSSIN